MRRLSMKGKRGRFETSSSESEENGVAEAVSTTINNPIRNEISDNTDEDRALSEVLKKGRGRSENAIGTPGATSDSGKRGRRNIDKEPALLKEDEAKENEEQHENGSAGKPGAGTKKRKKEDAKASTSKDQPSEEKEYEVEKIVSYRTIKGRRQFLVRWKGYDEDSDTWEQEKDLNCSDLIEQFLSENEENESISEPPKRRQKTEKTKASKSDRKSKNKNGGIDTDKSVSDPDKNEGKEFEVEKIIDVYFKKNKTREFLIRWKGFSSGDDSWEPEENLNCPELIAKFMDKVEKAKIADQRELRTNPAHTKRYTLTTPECGRRLSRRNMDKQRTTYHQCDE
ncbi:chromatin-associated protein swi6 [Cephus cinctus]|uniref:Chromatin-associated protein swi6 n=1 Tax=Cephus cinctus TaxID=211228 RepID=A0AAJ7FFH1_CEPCN|nr:chromatin-associated protein swi6 [Cephus cinctus]